jgi:hypothetical protein
MLADPHRTLCLPNPPPVFFGEGGPVVPAGRRCSLCYAPAVATFFSATGSRSIRIA